MSTSMTTMMKIMSTLTWFMSCTENGTDVSALLAIFRLRDSNITSSNDRHVDYIRLSYLKQL